MEGNPAMTHLHNARQRLAGDPLRPQYHFLPPANWMNDPNGLIHWQGRYHLFYQYNPNGPFHGSIHWGHAASQDMLHWQDLPIALAPTPGGPDAGGCWSGCAVDHDGVPTLGYTGVHPQAVCLAAGSSDLLHWDKHPANPVIPGPPLDLSAATGGDFRDPFVWMEKDGWHMLIGSRLQGQGGAILHYRSYDLLGWDYRGVLLRGDIHQSQPFFSGFVWECPNFFRFGERGVLFFSVQSEAGELLYPVYYTGDFDGERFQPRVQDILVHGSSFYAPQALRTQDGRVVMWGWLKEQRNQSACSQAGWSGVMSAPLSLSLPDSGRLQVEPVEELKTLRGEHWHTTALQITPGDAGWLGDLRGSCLEIEAVLEAGETSVFGLSLLGSADGRERTRLVYDGERRRLILDARQSSLDPEAPGGLHEAPLGLESGGALRLRILLDRSVIEVFAGGVCLACRVYPTLPDSAAVDLFALRGSVRLKSLDAWTLNSV